MAKGVKRVKGRKSEKRSKEKNVKAGDLYVVNTDIEVVDVDGDGLTDVVFIHAVDTNGEKFVKARVEWYGLGDEIAEAFVETLSYVGLVEEDDVEYNKFNKVVKHWKQLTKALAKINKLGDQTAIAIGEDVDADPEVDKLAK